VNTLSDKVSDAKGNADDLQQKIQDVKYEEHDKLEAARIGFWETLGKSDANTRQKWYKRCAWVFDFVKLNKRRVEREGSQRQWRMWCAWFARISLQPEPAAAAHHMNTSASASHEHVSQRRPQHLRHLHHAADNPVHPALQRRLPNESRATSFPRKPCTHLLLAQRPSGAAFERAHRGIHAGCLGVDLGGGPR
jgi:hypothetical protein